MENLLFKEFQKSIGRRFLNVVILEITKLKLSSLWQMHNSDSDIIITKFKHNKMDYFFYESNGPMCILTKKYEKINNKFSMHHNDFITKIGHIIEFFMVDDSNTIFTNLTEAFANDDDCIGLGDFATDYIEKCNKSNLLVVDSFINAITFAFEANGNRLMYIRDNEEVIMYAHDHCRVDIKPFNGVPPYTFYNIQGIQTLSDFINKLFFTITNN